MRRLSRSRISGSDSPIFLQRENNDRLKQQFQNTLTPHRQPWRKTRVFAVNVIGAGVPAAQVKVQRRGEVAQLARSFNHAAEKFERLIDSQQAMLASASHEFRPLWWPRNVP